MRWVEHVAHIGNMQYKMLVWKPKGKKPSGRPRHRLDDLRMDLSETVPGCGLALSGTEQGPMTCLQTQ